MKARQFKFNGLMVKMLREQMKLRPCDLAQITGTPDETTQPLALVGQELRVL